MPEDKIARLRIDLLDSDPEIWRVVDVPLASNLKTVHDIIQAAMGWEDYHLWEFQAGNRRYGLPDPEWPDAELAAAKNVTLGALVERGVRQLEYLYDMGDGWEHGVTIESIGPGEPNTKYPRFVAGARRCPPEDVGGIPGFQHFLEVMADPGHEEHREVRDWYGAPFDPDDFNEPLTKVAVGRIAVWRAAGKAAAAKRRT